MKKIYIVPLATTFFSILFVSIFFLWAPKLPKELAMEVTDTGGYEVSWDSTIGTIYPNISYGAKQLNSLDIYIPSVLDKKQSHGLILYIHGGSWNSGDKKEMEYSCRRFTKAGYITATMNYSLFGDSLNPDVSFNTMLGEISLALQRIKAYTAAMGIDIDRVAISGYSAGAHLAMLYAYSVAGNSPIPISFVESKVGPADFRAFNIGSPDVVETLSAIVGTTANDEFLNSPQLQEMLAAISPVEYITGNSVPTILSYGKRDKLVQWDNVVSITSRLKSNNIDYVLVEYPNSGHDLNDDSTSTEQTIKVMLKYLKHYFDANL